MILQQRTQGFRKQGVVIGNQYAGEFHA